MSDASLQTITALLDGQSKEFRAQWAGLRYELEARFDAFDDRLKAIDDKQRIANGRVNKMEGSLERVGEQIARLQKAEGDHETRINDIDRRQSRQRRVEDREPKGERASITRRDVAMYLFGASSMIGLAKAAVWVFHEIKALL